MEPVKLYFKKASMHLVSKNVPVHVLAQVIQIAMPIITISHKLLCLHNLRSNELTTRMSKAIKIMYRVNPYRIWCVTLEVSHIYGYNGL